MNFKENEKEITLQITTSKWLERKLSFYFILFYFILFSKRPRVSLGKLLLQEWEKRQLYEEQDKKKYEQIQMSVHFYEKNNLHLKKKIL